MHQAQEHKTVQELCMFTAIMCLSCAVTTGRAWVNFDVVCDC